MIYYLNQSLLFKEKKWSLSLHQNISQHSLFLIIRLLRDSYIQNWKYNTVVDKTSFSHVNRIHPIKQRMVKGIVDAAREDKEFITFMTV